MTTRTVICDVRWTRYVVRTSNKRHRVARDNSFVSVILSAASREITRFYEYTKGLGKFNSRYDPAFFPPHLLNCRDICFRVAPCFLIISARRLPRLHRHLMSPISSFINNLGMCDNGSGKIENFHLATFLERILSYPGEMSRTWALLPTRIYVSIRANGNLQKSARVPPR